MKGVTTSDVLGVLKGASLGFLAYAGPMLLLKRKLTPEVLRAASAIAVFVGSYRVLRLADQTDRPVSAGIATLAGCAVDPSFASPLFTFWLTTKGARVFLPEVPSAVPVAALMVASAYAIPTGYKHPVEVHPSYQKFLEAWVTAIGVSPANWRDPPGPGKILSDGIHPGQSMTSFLLTRAVPGCLLLAAKFNAPLYLGTAAMQWRKLDLGRHAVSFLRSVTFLGGYVASCWAGVLLYSKYVSGGTITRNQCMSFAWIFGLWGAVERPSRQVELAAYILAHALYALYTRLCRDGALGAVGATHRFAFAVLLTTCGVAPLFVRQKNDKKPSMLWRHLLGED